MRFTLIDGSSFHHSVVLMVRQLFANFIYLI